MIKKINFFFLQWLFFGLLILQFSDCRTDPKSITSSQKNTKTVVIRLKSEPDYLVPILTTSSNSRKVFRHVHAPLMKMNPKSMEYFPYLLVAEPKIFPIHEGELDGGFRYEFELRKEAKWDNGAPVLANDVVFTFKAMKNPKVLSKYAPGINFFYDIIQNQQNPRKFSVLTKECNMNAVKEIVTTDIYPKYYYDPTNILDEFSFQSLKDIKAIEKIDHGSEKLQNFATSFKNPEKTHEKVQGAGAYRIKEWIAGQKIVLEKKDNWWGKPFENISPVFVNKPQQLVYKTIPDETTAITMAKAGEIDVISDIGFENFDALKHNAMALDEMSFFNPRTSIYYYLAFNTQRKVLKDKRVRRAIALITDVDYIIKNAMHGYAKRIVGPIMPYSKNYNHHLKLLKFDLEESSRLLDDAGWKDTDGDGWRDKVIQGKKTPLKVEFKYGSRSKISKLMAQMMAKSGKKIGVKIESVIKDGRKILTQDAPQGDFDMITLGARVILPYNPYNAFHTDNFPPRGQNKTRFGTPESDAIIERIITNCDDPTQMKKDYFRLQEIIYEEQPMIFLFNAKGRLVINKKFANADAYEVFPGFMENWLE